MFGVLRHKWASMRAAASKGADPPAPPPVLHRVVPAKGDPVLNGEQLEQLAAQIPSMGGREIGSHLRRLAREAPKNTSIVEVGSWLGAGTAQLALGLRERPAADGISIHCYDRWEATDQEVEKAIRLTGLQLQLGQDTLPLVAQMLTPFSVPISLVKGDIRQATWDGGPISVYIDDAAKTPPKFMHMLKTFGPHWIPGRTVVVLMDYYYWQTTGSEKHKGQKRFVETHADHFALVDGFRTDTSEAFIYRKPIDFQKMSSRILRLD